MIPGSKGLLTPTSLYHKKQYTAIDIRGKRMNGIILAAATNLADSAKDRRRDTKRIHHHDIINSSKTDREWGIKMKWKLLIVEDDHLIAEAASDYFSSKGWEVETKADGVQALNLLQEKNVHLVLLDVMLPGMDGFGVCREIRKKCDVPVIFITARSLEEDMLNGYSLGADDYVTKPFSLPVLYAKAMALTGRVQKNPVFLEAGGLRADLHSHKVTRFGEVLPLPPKEYAMLLFFMQNPGRIYSREQLLIRFWGYDFDGNERVVDNHIKKLRKAMGACGCSIETVPKSGYRLDVP